MKSTLIAASLAVAALSLAGCDEPAPWARAAKAPELPIAAAKPRLQSITWNGATNGFEADSKPLKAGRLWTFDGTTEGFVLAGGGVLPATPTGMSVNNSAFDPVLRSPKGLALDGSRYSLVLVRMTRLKPGAAWDGSIFYTTPAHGESGAFRAKPVEGGAPAVNETVVMVYDMARPKRGGEDWTNSLIDQIRLDTDDQGGGGFLIHQIAVTENPGLDALGITAPDPAAAPVQVKAEAEPKKG